MVKSHTRILHGLSASLLGVLFVAAESHAATCESLRALVLPDTTITLAEAVAAGAFSPPVGGREGTLSTATFQQLPAFCRVAATLRPSADSDIRIEVWMPLTNWNGKFQGVGNGGLGGFITYANRGQGGLERGMAEALRRGYATSSTDTGHTGDTAAAFLGHPEKLVDFGYRAVHEMTVKAKAIINAFYNANPRFSYWNGCSLGGRQGLMEARRFPADYDGIIAGAPALSQRLTLWSTYVGQAALKEPANVVPSSKYPMIHRAVVNACDAVDGLADGLIGDPTRCRFDFTTLECKGEDAASCLTAAQVKSAQTLTTPLIHPKTGETIFPGLARGTELGWATRIGGPEPNFLPTEYFKYVFYKDPNWDWRTFDLESAVALVEGAPESATLNATNPDLSAFKQRGGKLLLYHGWSDQNFSAESTIRYYESVRDAVGSTHVDEWLRLFLVPGMGHCGGGEGPNTFDHVAALEQWIENGHAPGTIVASHRTDGKVDRTRPLCPYPQVAKYRGAGSIDEAMNFTCRLP